MDKFSLVPLHRLRELLWLQVRLCRPLDAEGVSSWLLRDMLLLKAHGLQGAVSTSRIVVMGVRQPINHAQRAAVMQWVMSQPEVADVLVGTGALPCRYGRDGEVRHG